MLQAATVASSSNRAWQFLLCGCWSPAQSALKHRGLHPRPMDVAAAFPFTGSANSEAKYVPQRRTQPCCAEAVLAWWARAAVTVLVALWTYSIRVVCNHHWSFILLKCGGFKTFLICFLHLHLPIMRRSGCGKHYSRSKSWLVPAPNIFDITDLYLRS